MTDMLLKAAHSSRNALQWTDIHNVHILVDLHQKADKNVRDVCLFIVTEVKV